MATKPPEKLIVPQKETEANPRVTAENSLFAILVEVKLSGTVLNYSVLEY